MNDVAKQLRTNADFVLGGTGLPPDAAIAGALQMGADEIDRLTRELGEALKENESLAFRIKASASAALGFMDQRDQLERQLAEAKKENERLTCAYLRYESDAALFCDQLKVLARGVLAARDVKVGGDADTEAEMYHQLYIAAASLTEDKIRPWSFLEMIVGPLPAAPNEAGK